MKDLLRKVYYFCRNIYRLNLLMTLYVNFKKLPFVVAIKFPIFVYGKLKIHSLGGKMIVNGPIKKGMIKIGYRWIDLFPSSYLPNQIYLLGTLTFSGETMISGGVGLFVQARNAYLEIGDRVVIGAGSIVKSMDKLVIGKNTRIAGNCTVMNSNMHFVKNIQTGEIAKPYGKILIGNNCWINPGSVITKGTVLPDYTIVARNSFVNKDYSSFGENLFLVGSPAKPTQAKVQRIFSLKEERRLSERFRNSDLDKIIETAGLQVENNADPAF